MEPSADYDARCPHDGQTLAWHQRSEIGSDGKPRTNAEFIGCDWPSADHRIVHHPRCNTYCVPGGHHLTDGIGLPHIHRTDLNAACGECIPTTEAGGASDA